MKHETAAFSIPFLVRVSSFNRHNVHKECVASVQRVLTKQKANFAVVGREELDRQHIAQVGTVGVCLLSCRSTAVAFLTCFPCRKIVFSMLSSFSAPGQ